MRHVCLLLVAAVLLHGQTSSRSRKDAETKTGWVHGSVISDATGAPLLRALVLLKFISGQAPSVVAETDEKGRFVINKIVPGQYALLVQRDGYLTTSSA